MTAFVVNALLEAKMSKYVSTKETFLINVIE